MPIELERKPLDSPAGVAALLSTMVHDRTGVSFEPARHDLLLEKLHPLAESRGCQSFLDYYYLLKYEENNCKNWDDLYDAISVPESYFWREMAQIEFLVKSIIPAWFKRFSAPLRIWSAASASGEEAYSIALAIAESPWASYPIEIHASDASPAAIERARKASYREYSFRALPAELRQKYFQEEGRGSTLLPHIAQRVAFQRANLLAADEIQWLAQSPIIYCRNVFIYFSPHAIRQTVAALAARMRPGGYLFIGASESLMKMTTDFELREIEGAFAYVRI